MSDVDAQKEQDVLKRLASENASLARQAAFDAGDLRLESAVPLLVEHFANSSVGVQEASERALRQIRGAAAVRAVIPLLRSQDAVVRNIAMDVLREIGVDDLATLTRLLYDQDPDIRIFIADILGSSDSSMALAPLCDVLLHDSEVNVRYQAAVSLGELRRPEAVESLRQALDDEEWVQYAVMEALAKIKDGSCVDVLVHALDRCSPLVASTVLDALGEINSVKSAPMLLSYLDKSSGPLRIKALKAIIRILGPNSLSLLGAKQLDKLQAYMLAALDDEDEDTVKVVLQGLAFTGVNPTATRAVFRLVERTDPVRQQELLQHAFQCIVGIGYNEALEEALLDSNELVCRMAVDACGHIEGRAGKYALKRHFDALPAEERQRAMEILARCGDDRDIPFFNNHMDTAEDAQVLRSALEFLGNNMRHRESAPRMLALLHHPDPAVKEAALSACLALEDEDTVRAIVAHAEDEDPDLRRMAVYTMGYVNAGLFAEQLARAVQDPVTEVRRVGLEAIGYGWPPSPEKLAALEFCLRDESRDVRQLAVELLGTYGEEGGESLLLEALHDPDDWVRVRAVEALGRNRVSSAVPELVTMMEHSNLLVQLKIAEALGQIGGDMAFQALLGFMSYESPEVQAAAAEAIDRIRGEEESQA